MPALLTLLTFCYPLVVHLSIYAGHAIWAAFFLAFLMALPLLLDVVRRERPAIRNGLLACSSLFILTQAEYQAATVLKIYPLLMFGSLFTLFASSLVAGKTPLISRFAILMRGTVPDAEMRYARHATVAWSIFFFIMIAASLYLSLFASLEAWSWFSNVFSYLLVGLMFVIEFAVRRRVLKEHVNHSFIQFLHELKGVDYRRLLRI
jgi:uncharacterized membrane protein